MIALRYEEANRMRILPRIVRPRLRRIGRRISKWWQRYLSAGRLVSIFEGLVFGGALLYVLSGSRAASVDRLGPRTDLFVLVGATALLALLHLLLFRHIVPILERYFSPAPYDERRILFDLGQEARAATNMDQLYNSIVNKIGDALETESVSIFVRDDETGEYVCRICAPQRSLHKTYEPRRGSREAAVMPGLSLGRNAFVVKRLHRLTTPWVIEEADLDAWERAFVTDAPDVREARERESETLRRIKASLLVQIRIKQQLVGILSVGPRRARRPYSIADKEMLMSVAGELAFVIENSKLVERTVEEERLRRELALAAEVQQRLFPENPPSSRSLELAGYCQPARGVGGDYYDFLALDDEQIGIAVADVAGKGISAALVMSVVQASLRSQTMSHNDAGRRKNSLAELVSTMNRLLCSSTGTATYVTFFYAQFDERTRRLTYINAGHNPPLLLRSRNGAAKRLAAVEAGGGRDAAATERPRSLKSVAQAETAEQLIADVLAMPDSMPAEFQVTDNCSRLSTGGVVIGLFDNSHYEQETIQLQSGDMLVAYTDGVTEALNEAGEEFGEERLQNALPSVAHLSANEARDSLVRSLQVWCSGAAQHDDLTFIVLKVK
jgi:sigma-B regulation protein RsbU (phosphoserine phosphatase)